MWADVGYLIPAPSEGLPHLGSQRQTGPWTAALGKLYLNKRTSEFDPTTC